MTAPKNRIHLTCQSCGRPKRPTGSLRCRSCASKEHFADPEKRRRSMNWALTDEIKAKISASVKRAQNTPEGRLVRAAADAKRRAAPRKPKVPRLSSGGAVNEEPRQTPKKRISMGPMRRAKPAQATIQKGPTREQELRLIEDWLRKREPT